MSDILLTVNDIAGLLNVTKQAVTKRAGKESWTCKNGSGKGGTHRLYPLLSLPGDIQKTYVETKGISPALLPSLAPEAAIAAAARNIPTQSFTDALAVSKKPFDSWTAETAVSEKDLRDPRVRRILEIIREAQAVPKGWKKRSWVESVALRYGVTFQSVYRWMKKYEKKGIYGIVHTKSTRGTSRKWTPEAVDFWVGLCLKRAHRKIDLKNLYYDALVIEAHRRGWTIGGYESALWWLDKKATPQLRALQKGGMRALDNLLPPVLRTYADLCPFELLVGDQHRFDFWVVDDETGEIFRPEGYFWQDLRTRIIYGGAVDKKYDAWLIGLALRIGCSIYGAFGSIYTDNGKPEISKYLMGILSDMRALGLSWETTTDIPADILDVEPEDVNPVMIMPGTHKKAIVKNAKAKMIEGTFDVIEGILRSRFRIPGYVKDLGGDIHENDVDQEELKLLAAQGKLLLFSEFTVMLYRALDWYNRQKPHKGVHKEWSWKPKPKAVTPYDCLRSCYEDGWRPKEISESALDLIFLERKKRTVKLGRVPFLWDWYEHDALIPLHREKVDVRYNPMAPEGLLVFSKGQYLCTAMPVVYSSMKDRDLAALKIMEKRSRRKRFAEEFKKITAGIPDFRHYSEVPQIEKDAARYALEKHERTEAEKDLFRTRTPEELEKEVRKLEALGNLPPKTKRPLPKRPNYFIDEFARFKWCLDYEIAGGTLNESDDKWLSAYEAAMSNEQREYWNTVRECGGM